MPWAFSLSSSLWCGTLSKAFLKSKIILMRSVMMMNDYDEKEDGDRIITKMVD